MNRLPAFFLLFVASVLMLSSCGTSKKLTKAHQKYLPVEVRDLYFGMAQQEALSKHPQAEFAQDENFRKVYIEQVNSDDLEFIVYYFDVEPTQILYEFILNYKNEQARDKVAADLLGKPNYKNTEWLFETEEGFLINAWKFKNRLVLAAKIAGTEWENE